MKLSKVAFSNFRLLRDTSVRFSDAGSATILVGPNNSGKTSVADALQLFTTGSVSAFSVNDFSLSCRADFESAQSVFLTGTDEQIQAVKVPSMAATMHFDYGDIAEDLICASDLLMDLDPTCNSVALKIEVAVTDRLKLAEVFKRDRDDDQSLCDFLSEKFSPYFAITYHKVSPTGSEAQPLPDGKIVPRIIRVDFVGAQRHIDDKDVSQATRLSRLLHSHYANRYEADDPQGYSQLKKELKTHSAALTVHYLKAFKELVKSLTAFGYPQRHAPDLSVKAELDACTLFKDNTRVYYATVMPTSPDDQEVRRHELPEKYNGLGFKNLIYMILQAKSFQEACDMTDGPRPRVHLIVIEEPEAHLHPQVQAIFIKRIAQFLTDGAAHASTQLLLTTHSSNIVADCDFSTVRYFRRVQSDCSVQVKDLLDFTTGETEDARRFVAQYLTQTRCDLLFADKAILVEGAVERLLLPTMVAGVATGKHANLAADYISTVEVGGAYAHLFKNLLKFLGIPALIITDVDAVAADRKKCPVAEGVSTSNATLKSWLPGKASLADLRNASGADKIQGSIRVAYQIPDLATLPCGRSFEEAFVYANIDWLVANASQLRSSSDHFADMTSDELRDGAYSIATERFGKVDFALDLMLNPGWQTPLYITEGLTWLAEQSI